ncbi:MAG: GTP-binding protein [Candidatus Lokiarchaeota archaeon]|nr:GTP-binding protein [Candidatus Lokiarchaeota archaeon]
MRRILRRQYKVCLIGNGFVGKTSIRREYLKEGFKRSYIPTLGVDFAQKQLKHKDIPTTLVIWDIAGQEAYQNLRRQYYQGCAGIILVYSVVDRQSLDDASKWLVEAHGFIQKFPPLIIAANKIDLRPTHLLEETVTTKEGLEFTERFKDRLGTPVIFLETSALDNINIDEAFEALTRMMVGEETFEEIETDYPPVHEDAPKAQVPEMETKEVEEQQESTSVSFTPASESHETAKDESGAKAFSTEFTQKESVEEQKSEAKVYTPSTQESTSTEKESAAQIFTSSSEEDQVVAEESTEEVVSSSSDMEEIEKEKADAVVFSSESETREDAEKQAAEVEQPAREIVEVPYTEEGDLEPITSLPPNSEYLKEEEIGKAMAKLVELRKKLKEREEELANILSEAEKKLLTLKNTVHVKKLMYDHLQEQLEDTRKEWADAYDEYVQVDKAKKKAVSKKLDQMKDIRDHIEEVGRGIRKRVSKLDLKNMAE